MVNVPYKLPIPASPPASPPRCSDDTAVGTNTLAASRAAAALKAAMRPGALPTPDTSRDTVDEPERGPPVPRPPMPALSDFELIRVLGKGCAGRVLLVKHTHSARVHAMKAISKRAVLANDELDHTLSEQEILRHFSTARRRNAFISRLYYSFSDKENFYLVMEFYPGGDLATQMEIHGILGPLRTRFYTCDIVAGLEALHREGILVRDLKPENILLNWHGHAVLADFGLSKNFGVRGDPVPVKLPPDYIEGKGTPPPYAGKGFGSYRNGELTWDRAYSFVGTQEYLAPEVIKRNHYTYAIDWWALGCIVCECLTGRVPFRSSGDESNAELYDRVINAPWDAIYRGEHPTSYLKERYRIDSMTYDFIDGLLQKEPMFRLTEPSVKQHLYFTNVDWDTVDKGDYQDPHQLPIDPVAEYNTKFFPRLCLEETPTVDMSGHDYGKDLADVQNALNNDEIYAKAQAQFHKELESFEWSCLCEEGEGEEGVEGVEGSAEGSVEEPAARSDETAAEVPVEATPPQTPTEELSEEVPLPTPEVHLDSPPVAKGTPSTRTNTTATASTTNPSSTPTSVQFTPKSKAPSISPSIALPPPTEPDSSSPTPTMSVPVLPAVEIESMDDFFPDPQARIPSGLPSSGLSVSDIIAIPASVGLPLIIRRHRQLPSIDSYPYPHARLSVDLNGTFGQLGDEEWEQLDSQQIPEAINGKPSLLRHIGLGRRPSRAVGRSTLRKDENRLSIRLENTKRAIKHAFPPAKDRSSSGSTGASLSPSPSAVSSLRTEEPVSLKRNSFVSALSAKRSARSSDLQGLFVRPKARRARSEEKKEREDSVENTENVSVTHTPVPRVELVPTPPIVWGDLR